MCLKMFTGIVNNIGQIKSVEPLAHGLTVVIACDIKLLDIELGDSISVNGVCSTVTHYDSLSFTVQYLSETLDKTSFKTLVVGDYVNLESSVTAQTKMGGHFVSGHIDGVGYLDELVQSDPWGKIVVKFDDVLKPNFIYKGSVCVDGISLTVSEIKDNFFRCDIIPHTFENTILKYKSVGQCVNIECDMFGKYVLRSLELGIDHGK